LVVAALGAVVLAVSVFLPWYGVSLTSAGLAAAHQPGQSLADQLGGTLATAYQGIVHGHLGAQEFTKLSGHQALRDLSVILLVLAGLALLDALIPLTRASAGVPEGAGGSLGLLGALAAACVVFRMCFPPSPGGELLALSTREGAWLALLGALAMVTGGLWPSCHPVQRIEELGFSDPWAVLASWSRGTR
jgi:hypothetical protein